METTYKTIATLSDRGAHTHFVFAAQAAFLVLTSLHGHRVAGPAGNTASETEFQT